jgi:hypothetical protein
MSEVWTNRRVQTWLRSPYVCDDKLIWLPHVAVISIQTDMRNLKHGTALIRGTLPQAGFLHGDLQGIEFVVTHRPRNRTPEDYDSQQPIVRLSNLKPVQADMDELGMRMLVTEEVAVLELIMNVECDLEWFVVKGHEDE